MPEILSDKIVVGNSSAYLNFFFSPKFFSSPHVNIWFPQPHSQLYDLQVGTSAEGTEHVAMAMWENPTYVQVWHDSMTVQLKANMYIY